MPVKSRKQNNEQLDRIENKLFGNGNEGLLITVAKMQENLIGLENKFDISTKNRDEKLDLLISKMNTFCNGTDNRIKTLELSKANSEGKASQGSVYISYALILLGWIVSIAAKLIK